MNPQPTFLFLTYLSLMNYGHISKACKPDNFESKIQGLRLNFVDCESFLESNSPDILALCETNLNGSVDSGNFFVRGHLPLIRKDSCSHMDGLTVYVKEGHPFARDLSLENSADSFLLMFSAGFTSLSALLLFPLLITFFVFVHGF